MNVKFSEASDDFVGHTVFKDFQTSFMFRKKPKFFFNCGKNVSKKINEMDTPRALNSKWKSSNQSAADA